MKASHWSQDSTNFKNEESTKCLENTEATFNSASNSTDETIKKTVAEKDIK